MVTFRMSTSRVVRSGAFPPVHIFASKRKTKPFRHFHQLFRGNDVGLCWFMFVSLTSLLLSFCTSTKQHARRKQKLPSRAQSLVLWDRRSNARRKDTTLSKDSAEVSRSRSWKRLVSRKNSPRPLAFASTTGEKTDRRSLWRQTWRD